MLAVLLAALDQTIVATALPKISSDFNASDQIGWVIYLEILLLHFVSFVATTNPLTHPFFSISGWNSIYVDFYRCNAFVWSIR